MPNEATINPEVRFEIDYLKTIHGKLNVAVIVLGIICEITIAITWGPFFGVAVICGLFNSGISLVFYLMHIPEKFYTIPWLSLEIATICIITVFYFIGTFIVAILLNIAAAIFGFIATVVYAYSGYLKYQSWRNGELAQGSLRGSSVTNNPSNYSI